MIFKCNIRFELVLIAIVFHIILTMLWYSPFLLGKLWSSFTGVAIDGPPQLSKLLIGIVSTAVLSIVLYLLIGQLGLHGWIQGLQIGGVLIVGFILAVHVPIAVYNETPLGLMAIDAGVFSIALLAQSVFFAQMN